MDAGQISRRLSERAEEVAGYLLPGGRRQGREFCAGSVRGEKGNSLKVCVVWWKGRCLERFCHRAEGGSARSVVRGTRRCPP